MNLKKTLVLSLLAVSAFVFAEAPKNLIRNPQFLDTKSKMPNVPDGRLPEPWYVHGGISALPAGCGVNTTEKPAGYTGNSYAVSGNILLNQSTFAVTPGKTYRISCKVKTKDVSAQAQIRLQIIWADKTWRELLKETNGQKSWDHKWTWVRSAPEWKELVIPEFTAPANAKYAKIRFGTGYSKEGTAWFADFKMEEVPQENKK